MLVSEKAQSDRVWRLGDFCTCSGGAAEGYRQAGWHVVGADTVFQPRSRANVFEQRDMLSYTPDELRERFDALHFSPPCQFASELTPDKSRHVNLIPQARALAIASGLPYVIENVRKARKHLVEPVSLFGTMFNLHMVTSAGRIYVLSRERLFETNWPLVAPLNPGTQGHPIANVFGGHLRCRNKEHRTEGGTGRTKDFPGEDKPALAQQLMKMPWATMNEMSEAVPPNYTAEIGHQLKAWVQAQAIAA